MNNFLVFLEQREGVVKQASIDTWNRVQELAASSPGSSVQGILAGPADIRQLDGVLAGSGVIYHATEEVFRLYNPQYYIRLVCDILKRDATASLIFADTALSRDLAPRLSVRLQASLLSGCSMFGDALRWDGGCERAVYSGTAVASFVPERPLKIYTIRSRITCQAQSSGAHISFVVLEPGSFIGDDFLPAVRRIVMREGSSDVAEARIIVAGGRGMGGPDGFAMLEGLARLLGGAVGASRAVVDEGWRPHAEQVGQTGKTVAPALYFACGISGAVQHLAGMGSAGIVVAINSDPHATIFDRADYGMVGDVHIVLPKLIDALHECLQKK
jgi:electron transfer flavoprotein alpha subunit